MVNNRKSFDKLIEDKDWAEIGFRAPSLRPDKASKALRAICNDPTVPVDLIGSLLNILQVYRNRATGTAYKLASFVKQGPDVDQFCRTVCVRSRPAVLKEFLKVLPGTYRTHRGKDYSWPSPQAARHIVHAMWYNVLKDIDNPKKLLTVSNKESLRAVQPLSDLWEKTEMVLMAGTARNIERPSDCGMGPWLVIHAAAAVGCCSPIIWFGLKLFPNQIRTRDYLGRFPLHHAVSDLSISSFQWPKELRNEIPLIVPFAYLIQLFPEAAKSTDCRGRIPLTIALESGKWWLKSSTDKGVSGSEDTIGNDEKETFMLKCLSYLMRAAPDALVTRDARTHLWPFLSAAVEDAPLTTIYNILRTDPAAIKHRQEETTQMMLRNKVLALEEKTKCLEQLLERERAKTGRLEDEVERLKNKCKNREAVNVKKGGDSDQGNKNKKRPRSFLLEA